MRPVFCQRVFNGLKQTNRSYSLHDSAYIRPNPNTRTNAAFQLSSPGQRGLNTSPIPWTEQHNSNAENLLNRDRLDPSRTENSQSGTDSEVSSHDAPFDPSNNSPESEMEATGRESSQRHKPNNPLDVSPANRDVSKTRDPSQEPADRGVDRPPSAQGWTRKSKPVNQEKH